MAHSRKRLTPKVYAEGIKSGDRVILSRAITLIESTLESDRELANEVLDLILPETGKALRIGITGVPGVGKSTFIESFGKMLTQQDHSIAVLTIDPTSQRTRGSILGDKTRMETLAKDPRAYIRPSASGDALGGVGQKTRESMLLCEAAGYDVIIVETVGVGQSETTVHEMVDFFLLLMLAGAGDELQGIKKGIMEMADAIAITKADGENLTPAKKARKEYQSALHLFPPAESGWFPKVLTCSALKQQGLEDIWEQVRAYEAHTKANGYFLQRRKEQNLHWMHQSIGFFLKEAFYHNPEIKSRIKEYEEKVKNGEMHSINAARELLTIFWKQANH